MMDTLRFTRLAGLVLILIYLLTGTAFAGPLQKSDVPEPLKPWTDWVLLGQEEALCPFLNDLDEEKPCAWSSPLTLSLDEKSGRFAGNWRLFAAGWVPLPGDEEHWPLGITVDGQSAGVVLFEDRPQIFLKPGDHTIQGTFQWDALPESFPIPEETAALKLTVRGTAISRPNLTDDGILWLQAATKEGPGEDSIDARINRRMDDDIPFVLTTAIDLDVSGKTREETFAPLLPKGFVPMALESPLPAHLEEDGRLKVQVRSGHWQIKLKARHEGPVSEIGSGSARPISQPGGSGEDRRSPPLDEVWVLEPRPELRQVTIEGVEAIDPQQTTLPNEWKRLAAYQVPAGSTVKLVEQRRGDSDPAPDQLTLRRDLWLDFNGGGYTVQDRIGGTFNRSARLEMNAPVTLGRVSVAGQDQLITRLPGGERAGIEVRQGWANIGADSRIDHRRASIPAIGWDHDFQSVSGTLHLPPGWRAIAVWGADHVPNTWLNRWSLLDIFLVLVLALSFAKIWNTRWGGIALATLVLTFPESGAPKWVWLAVIVGEALVRLLPQGFKGKIRIPLKLYRGVTVIILLLVVIPFTVVSLRKSLYPSLEREIGMLNVSLPSDIMYSEGALPPPAPAPAGGAMNEENAPMEKEARDEPVVQAQTSAEDMMGRKVMMKLARPSKKRLSKQASFQQIPNAQVQTGPGLPRWNWTDVRLEWSGPVAKGQKLRLILLCPGFNLFLTLVRVILLALLVLRILGFPGRFWPPLMKRYLIGPLALAVGLGLLVSPRAALADFPTPQILTELREKLVAPPECSPRCAAVPRLFLEATPTSLRIRMEIAAQALTAVPLPANSKEWIPTSVSIDGGKFAGVRRSEDGRSWIEVGPGLHQVVIEGPLADRQSLQIPFPLKPHHVETSLKGWSVQGIHEDGQADDNLELTRTEPLASTASAGTKGVSNTLPSFVRVERRVALGITWSVETRVVRLTPTGSSIVLEVPLLAGESVTTDGVRVRDSKVLISMGPQAEEFSWSSVLQQTDTLNLVAPSEGSWVEIWEADASPIWHLDYEGIPLIRASGEDHVLQWRPWPGEKVAIKVSRPEGVPGQTATIDESSLALSPGLRFTEATLRLTVRSSLGGQQIVTLPENSELQSVSVNGSVQPIRQSNGKVTLPLTPGAQNFEIKWQQPGGIGIFFRSPAVDLGTVSVNSEIRFELPERWVFLVGGPSLGPAVLFWSLLIVMILIAVGLSRSGLAPLKTHHWILLSLGLTQTPVWASMIFAGWFLGLGWRAKAPRSGPWTFDLLQVLLGLWTVTAIIILFVSIHQGLLGSPDMQILGNDSTSRLLRWFLDRSGSNLPRPWVLSLPMFCYRIAMLSWALWVAWAFIGWIRWGWKCFTKGSLWKPVRLVRKSS